MLTDYRYGLRWRYVVTRDPVVVAVGVKIFLDELFPPRESVSSAHVPIMADRVCLSAYCKYELRLVLAASANRRRGGETESPEVHPSI
jgi:hypothetical protein